jgi:hypothetical protein
MIWVIVFVSIALAGLIMCICYAVWLAHKAADVWSEVDMLAQRGAEFADLLEQIQVPERDLTPAWQNDRLISAEIDQASAT